MNGFKFLNGSNKICKYLWMKLVLFCHGKICRKIIWYDIDDVVLTEIDLIFSAWDFLRMSGMENWIRNAKNGLKDYTKIFELYVSGVIIALEFYKVIKFFCEFLNIVFFNVYFLAPNQFNHIYILYWKKHQIEIHA